MESPAKWPKCVYDYIALNLANYAQDNWRGRISGHKVRATVLLTRLACGASR